MIAHEETCQCSRCSSLGETYPPGSYPPAYYPQPAPVYPYPPAPPPPPPPAPYPYVQPYPTPYPPAQQPYPGMVPGPAGIPGATQTKPPYPPGIKAILMPGQPGYLEFSAYVKRGSSALEAIRPNYAGLIQILAIFTGDRDVWLANSADQLEELYRLVAPLKSAQVNGMCDWLIEIDPPRKYELGDLLLLVKKLLLKQKIPFPSIELSTRLVKFLRKIVRRKTPAEDVLEAERSKLKNQEYDLLKLLEASRLDLEAAKKTTYESGSEIRISNAEGYVQYYENEISKKRAAIQAIIDELNQNLQIQLTDDELMRFLLAQGVDKEFQERFNAYHRDVTKAAELLAPHQAVIQTILKERAGIVDQEKAAIQLEVAARAANSPDYEQIKREREGLTELYFSIQSRLDAAMAKQAETVKANPELYPEGGLEAKLPELMIAFLNHLVDERPQIAVEIIQGAMTVRAQDADDRMSQLLAQKAKDVEEKQKRLEEYIRVKAESELRSYRDQMVSAQNAYNSLAEELRKREERLRKLQDKISFMIEELGGVLGWWCNKNNIQAETMKEVWFIKTALRSIQSAAGGLDKATIVAPILGITKTEVFWHGEGESSAAAGLTLTLMGNLETEQYDYDYGEGKRLRDSLPPIVDWLKKLQVAYEMTYQRVNSEEFVRSSIREFKNLPEQVTESQVAQALSLMVRDISARVKSEQEMLQDLLEEMEERAIEYGGVDVPDLQYLSYEEKKPLWIGVVEFMEQKMPRFPELQEHLKTLQTKVESGQADAGDADLVELMRRGLLSFLCAQLIYRKLNRDDDLQFRMKREKEEEAVSRLNTATSLPGVTT